MPQFITMHGKRRGRNHKEPCREGHTTIAIAGAARPRVCRQGWKRVGPLARKRAVKVFIPHSIISNQVTIAKERSALQ